VTYILPATSSPQWVTIQATTKTNQPIGTFATTTWPALAYRQVRLSVRLLASGGGTVDEVKLVGLTGTYSSQRVYGFAGAAGSDSSGAKIVVFPAGTVGYRADYTFDLPAAPAIKTMLGLHYTPTVPPIPSAWAGGNTDTTNEVTGLQLITVSNICSFSFELYGLPY
jgi:hypothetical protein